MFFGISHHVILCAKDVISVVESLWSFIVPLPLVFQIFSFNYLQHFGDFVYLNLYYINKIGLDWISFAYFFLERQLKRNYLLTLESKCLTGDIDFFFLFFVIQ